MEKSYIGARIDPEVRARAERYIELAGSSVSEVIQKTFEEIARTGVVPYTDQDTPQESRVDRLRKLRGKGGGQ